MFKEFLLAHGLSVTKEKLELYVSAFTHPTFSNEHKNSTNYQRLEFFGDSVLSLFLARDIYEKHTSLPEGKMSIMKAHLESAASLANIARNLQLEKHIIFGRTKEGISNNDNILADVFESFLGAVYLNEGEAKAYEIYNNLFGSKINEFDEDSYKNPKTVLQEFLQTDSRATSPDYNI